MVIKKINPATMTPEQILKSAMEVALTTMKSTLVLFLENPAQGVTRADLLKIYESKGPHTMVAHPEKSPVTLDDLVDQLIVQMAQDDTIEFVSPNRMRLTDRGLKFFKERTSQLTKFAEEKAA